MTTPTTPMTSKIGSGARPAPFLGIVLVILLAIVLPMVITTVTATPPTDTWVLALASTSVAGFRFAVIACSRARRPFEMTTWLYLYTFLGLAPLVQARQQVDPETTPDVLHAFDGTAMSIVLVAEVVLIVGSVAARRAVQASVRQVAAPNPMRTTVLAMVMLLAGGCYIAFVGVATLYSNRQARDLAIASLINDDVIRTIIGATIAMGLLVSFVAQVLVWRSRKQQGKKRPILLLAGTLLALLTVVNPVGSPRFLFGTVLLSVLAVLGMFRSVQRFRWASIGALVAIVIVFPIMDSFRYRNSTEVESIDPLSALTSSDFDSFAQVVNTAWFVSANDISYGRQLLGVILFWVPRSTWPDKPVDTGILLAEAKGYGLGNLSAPLPAELFVNGGWPLLAVGMFILGFALRRWDARSETYLAQFGSPTILGSIMPFYMILLWRGSLLQSAASLTICVLLAWLVRGNGDLSRQHHRVQSEDGVRH